MYLLYKKTNCQQVNLPGGFNVLQKSVPIFSSTHGLLWNLTKGRGFYKCYTLINEGGEEVCTAETLNRCVFLRFLPQNAVHIGPCYTPPKHRGNGYYPMLINYISSLYNGVECFMFVREDNFASIKGIKKAGFKKIGFCKKFLNF